MHHVRAQEWFHGLGSRGWATCPLTESGFVRVSSNTRVIPDARRPADAISLLRRMRALPGHEFWTDDVSPADGNVTAFEHVVGYRQVTDAHLLTLAARRDGRLATFDQGTAGLVPDQPDLVDLIP